MAKRRFKYPDEVRPFMYCLRCAVLHSRLTLHEEQRTGGEKVWVCSAVHVIAHVLTPTADATESEPDAISDSAG
jgi:hypothetical protein